MSTPTPALTLSASCSGLDWQVIRRLDGLLQGDYRSLFYGHGIDFADLREYQPEDGHSLHRLERHRAHETPYVRQYVEDRESSPACLLDLSPRWILAPCKIANARVDRFRHHHCTGCSPAMATASAPSSTATASSAPYGPRRANAGAAAGQRPAQATAFRPHFAHQPDAAARRRAPRIKKRSLIFSSRISSRSGWNGRCTAQPAARGACHPVVGPRAR